MNTQNMCRTSVVCVLLSAAGAVAQPSPRDLPALPNFQIPAGSVVGQAAFDLAAARGWPVQFRRANGGLAVLSHVVNGRPQYMASDNVAAAATIRANRVHFQPGTTVEQFQGRNAFPVGVWEISRGRLTHQEFGARAVQSDAHPPFSAAGGAEGDHATHVMGTIIASGVNPQAKGIAPRGRVKAFDSVGDIAEMAAEALLGNMKFSNHSYGPVSGWEAATATTPARWHGDASISTQEDFTFGLYDIRAAGFDAFTAANPRFLSVWSAGNDRGESGPLVHEEFINGQFRSVTAARPTDGPFDTIAGPPLAKNVLAVGAVDDVLNYTGPASVTMSSFSGFGPADDGRIKPDVVSNGVDLFSCISTSNTAYSGTFSGTSMATPGVTGALALIQEAEERENRISNLPDPLGYGPEHFRDASTYKGLLIHTADECGTAAGPDYRFGWGLVNVERAVNAVINDARTNPMRISEEVLLTQTAFERIIQTTSFGNGAAGATPVKVTLAWTDPPHLPLASSLDPTTRAIVNDLDIRVQRLASDGSTVAETFFPWRLNRNSPGAAATRGDNNVDNVEQIEFSAANNARFRIRVTHKGILFGLRQNFSMIVTGARATPTGLLELGTQRGACCRLDGSCSFTSPLGCALLGTFRGPASVCSPNPCQPALGACCGLTGCNVVPPALCIAAVFRGAGTTCTPTICRTGACCVLGACTVVREGGCIGGFQGPGSVCSPNPCAGACCGLTGCNVTAPELCIGAIFRGSGTTCTPTICRTGACCLAGACSIIREGSLCVGGFKGVGSVCSPNPCQGACCGLTGCSVVAPEFCIGAIFKGSGTTCTPDRCRTGACCVSFSCTTAREGACVGNFHGAGSTCGPNECDFFGNGPSSIAAPGGGGGSTTGFHAGVADFLAGDMRADVNRDGVLNSADLIEITQRLVGPRD